MTPTYHTPEGDVAVAAPFGMAGYYVDQRPVVETNARASATAERRAGLSPRVVNDIQNARGGPDDIRRVTQALIDTGRLSANSTQPLSQRVRQMMFDHGVGIDCAGYVERAYLYASGMTRTTAGFAALANEDLGHLRALGFTRVPNVAQLRPGDIVSLGPPAPHEVGHRVIVYDQHEATSSEIQALLTAPQSNGVPEFLFKKPVGPSLQGTVYVVTVDSSWGCGGDPQHGGVERRTWWYNAVSKQWAAAEPSGPRPEDVQFVSRDLPYGHPILGFFRGPGLGSGGSPQP
jgi:hypothetical protein